MLRIGHAGYEFLRLTDSFLEWGIHAEYISAYYQLEAPPQRSLETFSRMLKDKGAVLVRTVESILLPSPTTYYGSSLKFYKSLIDSEEERISLDKVPGLVCSHSTSVKKIVKQIERGANLILLKPTHLTKGLVEKAEEFYNSVIAKFRINPKINGKDIVFQKFYFNSGKIIVVDGNFLTDWGTQNENYVEKINEILTEFLKFNVPVASLEQTNDQMVVPLNTSIYTEWTLRYWGPDGGQIKIEIEVDPSIEPESPTVLTLSDLKYGTKRTIGFWFTPRAIGSFKNAILIKAKGLFSQHLSISLTVFSGYKEKLKDQSIAKSIILNELRKVGDKIGEINDLDKFASLIEIDPRTAVMKARYIA